MFGIQPLHILAIAIVALIIFGPTRLPEIGRGLGKALNEFKRGTQEMTEGFRDEVTRPGDNGPTIQTPATPLQSQPINAGNFCTQCGIGNPTGAKFCNSCGSSLPQAE